MSYATYRRALTAHVQRLPLDRSLRHWPLGELLVRQKPVGVKTLINNFNRVNSGRGVRMFELTSLSARDQVKIFRELIEVFPTERLSGLIAAAGSTPLVITSPARSALNVTLPWPVATISRPLIILPGAASTLTVIEPSFVPNETTTGISAVTVLLAPDSVVHYYGDRRGSVAQLTDWRARLAPASQCHWATIGGGASYDLLSVTNTAVGAGSRGSITGLSLVTDGGRSVRRLTSEHRGPQTRGQITWRAAVGANTETTLLGWIKVAATARGTGSWLDQRALLTADSAIAHSIPNLAINTNDVAASHSASVGALEEAAIHYATTRGLTKEAAQSLLLRGWLVDAVQAVPSPLVRDLITSTLTSSL